MLEAIAVWWCRQTHRKIMTPVNGQYKCAECLREFPVTWRTAGCEWVPKKRSGWWVR